MFMKKSKIIMIIILLILYIIAGTIFLIWNYVTGSDVFSMLALEILAITGIVSGILLILDKSKK